MPVPEATFHLPPKYKGMDSLVYNVYSSIGQMKSFCQCSDLYKAMAIGHNPSATNHIQVLVSR